MKYLHFMIVPEAVKERAEQISADVWQRPIEYGIYYGS